MQINGINNVHGPQNISQPHRASSTTNTPATQSGDSVEISSEAAFLSRINDLPEIRSDKVADIRAQIAQGTYETGEKLDVAVSRLLNELA